MAYSDDLRQKALEMYDICQNKKLVVATFGVGRETIRNWVKLREETGELKHKAGGVRTVKVDKEKLKDYVEKNPDKFLHEIGEAFDCSRTCIFNLLKNMKITRKKNDNLQGTRYK